MPKKNKKRKGYSTKEERFKRIDERVKSIQNMPYTPEPPENRAVISDFFKHHYKKRRYKR